MLTILHWFCSRRPARPRLAVHAACFGAKHLPASTHAISARPPGVSGRSDDPDRHVDVAASCLGIGADPIRFLDDGLSDLALGTRQADVEASAEEVPAVHQAQIHFGVDTCLGRKDYALPASQKCDGAFETGRPAG